MPLRAAGSEVAAGDVGTATVCVGGGVVGSGVALAVGAGTMTAALVIAWPVLGRQVRVVGPAHQSTNAESDAYWANRPRGSQLAAVTSRQSRVLLNRAALDDAYAEAESMFEGRDVPRPAGWGGYVLTPERIEALTAGWQA